MVLNGVGSGYSEESKNLLFGNEFKNLKVRKQENFIHADNGP